MADWYFRNNRNNSLKVCPGCRNLVKKTEEFCPFCAKRLGPQRGWRGWGKKIFSRPDAVTRILLGVIIGVFLLQLGLDLTLPANLRDGGGGGLFSLLTASGVTYIMLGSNFSPLVTVNHEFWRWVTYCFLHFGAIHILFNCWAFRDLGRLAERFWGPKQVFSTFILTGIAAGAASTGWAYVALGQIRHSAGASGAICGVLGLLLGSYYRNRYHIGEHLGMELIRWAVYILVFGLVANADNAAHVGGMVAGAALGYFLPPTSTTRAPERDGKIWTILTWVSLALLLGAAGFQIAFALNGSVYAARISQLAAVMYRMGG